MLALLVGLAVISAARFSLRWTAAAVAALAAAAVVIAVLGTGHLHVNLSDTNAANAATSNRASLVTEGADLFARRPIAGYGSGSFSCEYLLHSGHRGCATIPGVTSDSHTIPITVAAEQGLIGLAAYVLLLAAAFWRLAGGGAGFRRDAARVAVLAAFAALVVHTWAYADFLEDPITWTLLAVGCALATAPEPRTARECATT
jgi:O-antigen ligase